MSSVSLRCPGCQRSFQASYGPTSPATACPWCHRVMRWFYAQNNQKFGPVGYGQLCHLADNGSLRPGDFVFQEGMTTWIPASQVPGVFGDRLSPATGSFAAGPPPRGEKPKGVANKRRSLLGELWAVLRAMITQPVKLLGKSVPSGQGRVDMIRAGVGYGMLLVALSVVLILRLANQGGPLETAPGQGQPVASKDNKTKPGGKNLQPAENNPPTNLKPAAEDHKFPNQHAMDVKQGPLTGKQIYEQTLKSTVLILTHKGSGTGCLVDAEQKLVITNSHVVPEQWTPPGTPVTIYFPKYRNGKLVAEKAQYQSISSDPAEKPVTGYVVRRDNSKDLALIKLDHLPPGVVPIKMAKDSPGPAETVHSIGNPGVSDALWVYTSGTVRQVYNKRYQSGSGQAFSGPIYVVEAKVVETQSPINPGDSGGPVVNEYGELVGLNQSFASKGQLFGTAIDISEIRALLEFHKKSPMVTGPLPK